MLFIQRKEISAVEEKKIWLVYEILIFKTSTDIGAVKVKRRITSNLEISVS